MVAPLLPLYAAAALFTAVSGHAAWEDTPLKVIILAGQSNMEEQAERDTEWGSMCKEQLPGQPPVCCWDKNVSG